MYHTNAKSNFDVFVGGGASWQKNQGISPYVKVGFNWKF
jgi:hypothetical protein